MSGNDIHKIRIGKPLRQYYLYFPNGDELYAFISKTELDNIAYIQRFRYKSNNLSFFNSSSELDKSYFQQLEEEVIKSLRNLSIITQARMKIIEFNATVDKEIEQLDKLWGEDLKMSEDTSKIDWLLDRIHDWETSNKEKGNIVEFFGSFLAISPEEDYKIVEDRVIAFGLKNTILKTLDEAKLEIEKDKEEFLNW